MKPDKIIFRSCLYVLLLPFLSYGQLSGNYTIGGVNPDFVTITQAVNALSTGISGPVIFNIRNGVYNEPISINFVPGASATNTITLQSESLDSSAVSIFWNSAPAAVNLHERCILKELCIIGTVGSCISATFTGCEVYNCIIDGGSGNSIYASHGNNIVISNNILTGDLNINHAPDAQITNNAIHGDFDLFYSPHSQIANNTIDNFFQSSFSDSCLITSNTILRRFNLGHSSNNQIVNNKFYDEFNMSVSDSCSITGNSFFFDFKNAFGYYNKIVNNLIYGYVSMQSVFYYTISFNNFTSDPGYYFLNDGAYNLIENNNMPSIFYGYPSFNTINNNNYPAGGGMYDSNPLSINPQYVSSNDLHATNIQLFGKAIYSTSVYYDIDSIIRLIPPTIGANEICISHDTLHVYCGDSIVLALCNTPIIGNFTWSPPTGLNNISFVRPTLTVSSSGWYILWDSIYGYRDSVYINATAFNVDAGTVDSANCGDILFLHATYNAGATYLWTPADSLTNPASCITNAFPSQTTTYTVTASVAGCGISYDTVTMYVNPLPTAYTYLDSVNYNYFSFLNASTCADTYYWDFGDSTQSTDVNPSHLFPDTGKFLVTLIACNSFGCDTFQGYVIVDSIVFTGINENTYIDFFNIYPNPAKDGFTIKLGPELKSAVIQIYNTIGECVYRSMMPIQSSIDINLNNISPGIYFVKVFDNKKSYCKKLIIE